MPAYGNFVGEFATDALALATIQARAWDDNGDGTGDPREGMVYYDTTTKQQKTYLNAAWVAEGNEGSIANVSLIQSGQPAPNDTITVGADVYEFDGVGANINVAIGGSAELTLDALLAAAVASGTEALLWEKISATELRLSNADGPQGNAIPGEQNIAISESAANWVIDSGSPTNLNAQAGHNPMPQRYGHADLTVVAGMVSAGNTKRIHFPFTVVRFHVMVLDASGQIRDGFSDTFTIDNGDVLITFAAGGVADLVATDVIHIEAWSA